ncbi:hypothetical protein ACIO8G_05645 [Streptomyces sp. NPDC087219]|uniref:hypothetical protein n=1 Tax=Streptomyces sp. NPDC087219 TaxID=3365770 RepID=UPI0038239B8D
MSARGEVFLGDLVRAAAGLRAADEETVAAIAGLLGVGPTTPAPSPSSFDRLPLAPRPDASAGGAGGRAASPRAPIPDVTRDARPAGRYPVEESAGRRGPSARERVTRLVERPVDFSLTSRDGRAHDDRRPPFADGSTAWAGPEPELLRHGTVTTGLRHEPPWKQGWARGVMFGVVATPAESTVCDQAALLRGVARQKALLTIPRRRRLTTRRGAQLLLDHGKAMVPFQDDRPWLSDLLGSIAGRDRVEVLRFRGTPRRGVVRDDPGARDPYRPPVPGTPVVLFSDLGRMRPPFAGASVAGADEWRGFIESVLRAGCPLICVTPYQLSAYREELRRRVAFIPLGRGVSIRHAQEATARVRRALGLS